MQNESLFTNHTKLFELIVYRTVLVVSNMQEVKIKTNFSRNEHNIML